MQNSGWSQEGVGRETNRTPLHGCADPPGPMTAGGKVGRWQALGGRHGAKEGSPSSCLGGGGGKGGDLGGEDAEQRPTSALLGKQQHRHPGHRRVGLCILGAFLDSQDRTRKMSTTGLKSPPNHGIQNNPQGHLHNGSVRQRGPGPDGQIRVTPGRMSAFVGVPRLFLYLCHGVNPRFVQASVS